MSYKTEQSGDDDQLQGPPLTINERIAKGRETGSASDGAILTFPPGFREEAIYAALRGGARERIDDLLWAGYGMSVHEYRSAEGDTIQAVLRFDHPEFESHQKEIRPVHYRGRFDGKGNVFAIGALKAPWPLYGLDRLAQKGEAPVLVVEGEKTADVAAGLFTDHAVISWMSGAPNVGRAEFVELAGRHIILWPDNDIPGRAAMRVFAARAYQAGAASVKIVDVPPEFGEGWDLADPVPEDCADQYAPSTLLETARLINPAEVVHLVDNARQAAEQRRMLGYKPGYSRVEIEHVATALEVLDPDMSANEWRQVAKSIFYAFGDRGLEMFDKWSQGSAEKYKDGEPARLWDAYANEANLRGLPLAWLFREAAKVLRERAQSESDKPNVELSTEAIYLAAIEELSEDHAVVVRAGKTAVLRESYDPQFRRYTETYLKKNDFQDLHVRRVMLPADQQTRQGNKTIAQGAAWFSSARRRNYESVQFAPGETLPRGFINSWRGFAVEPKDDPEGWSKLKEHIREHIAQGDEASYNYLLDWLAFAVQHLDSPIGVALVLIGAKGAGKTILTQALAYLFGKHAFVTSRMDDVVGRFNERLETTLLLGLEEAVAPQNKSADGTLKDILTRPTLRLEGKFFGVWDARNRLRVIVTSNNEHVVRADGSERRYAVFEVVNPHQADPHDRRRYFGAMMEQMENGGHSAMLGELLNRDISKWNPEAIPETEALKQQKLLNLGSDPLRLFLHERLMEGINITTGEAGLGAPIHSWSDTETVNVPARDLIADYKLFVDAHGLPFSQAGLARNLPKYMPAGFRATTIRETAPDGSRTLKVYPMPPLEVARSRFEEVTGLKIEREE
jgi:hypothetical protein